MIKSKPSWAFAGSFSACYLSCAILSAQSFATTPPGYLNSTGTSVSSLIGTTPAGRVMFLDGESRGPSRMIREVAFRRSTAWPGPTFTGRSWSVVSLAMSDGDLSVAKSVFAQNQLSTPARVFQGRVVWPTFNMTTSTANGFGGAAGELRFPFSTPWAYGGVRDIALDFDFVGGILSSGAPWKATTPATYPLDAVMGFSNPAITHTQSTSHGPSCRDSSQSADSFVSLSISSWGTTFVRISGLGRPGNQTFFYARHARIGDDPSGFFSFQPSLHVLGLGGSVSGIVHPGVSCARLHLDFAQPWVSFVPSIFRGGYHGPPPTARFFNRPQLVGTDVWYQAAWPDTQTGALRLTNVARATMPALPPTPFARGVVHQPDPALKGQSGSVDTWLHATILRYGW